MSKLQEEWKFLKEITGTNRYYKRGDIFEVSNFGNVLLNGQPHKCKIHNDGYYYLFSIPLHRIVAEKFLHDWDPTKQVDHKDTNRLNNRVDNLQMCTPKENRNNPLTLKHNSEAKKGTLPWNTGKHWDAETKKKISESLKGNIPWNKGLKKRGLN